MHSAVIRSPVEKLHNLIIEALIGSSSVMVDELERVVRKLSLIKMLLKIKGDFN